MLQLAQVEAEPADDDGRARRAGEVGGFCLDECNLGPCGGVADTPECRQSHSKRRRSRAASRRELVRRQRMSLPRRCTALRGIRRRHGADRNAASPSMRHLRPANSSRAERYRNRRLTRRFGVSVAAPHVGAAQSAQSSRSTFAKPCWQEFTVSERLANSEKCDECGDMEKLRSSVKVRGFVGPN